MEALPLKCMKISELYEKYNIPPNLKDHMFRVAGVASFIADHWIGSGIDKTALIKCALVHDLGNMVKFDFDKHAEFLGNEQKNIEKWIKIQKEMIAKYGEGDNEATNKILKEIGFPSDLTELIYSKRFLNSIHTLKFGDFILKILHYSDLRVTPYGVDTLLGRFAEMKGRGQYNDKLEREDLIQACIELEKQIQSKVDIPLGDITPETIEINAEEYLNFEI
jgi:hypothetical protein